ncbi:MAG: DUF2851 family protein [Verrucomicrobiales bacterium]|nr:DUF2851 family protein [Verrucomicrobiales bacterium]
MPSSHIQPTARTESSLGARSAGHTVRDLTLPEPCIKSNCKVPATQVSTYAQWRHAAAPAALHDSADAPPPEQLLQVIWQYQRIVRDQLKTLDGEAVKVLHPGFKNCEAGPDFKRAVIQFGTAAPVSGDVEIDVHPACWRTHNHHANPAYRNVVLHVVWDATPEYRPEVRTLPIRHALDSPLHELSWWLGHKVELAPPQNYFGLCRPALARLDRSALTKLLHQAAQFRLEAKAAQLRARARQAGWEQALWEALFRALGYKQNVWPMHRLAELKPRWYAPGLSSIELQARLLGLAGLLPHELTRRYGTADAYLRRVWDIWWRDRDQFSDCILPRAVWQFAGVRPSNHPQRRLALAAHWLSAGDLALRLERWLAGGASTAQPAHVLLESLQPGPDEFWSVHWTLRSRPLRRPQPLIGLPRLTDLAVNVFLPWLWSRAVEGNNDALRDRVQRWYFSWPAGEDNALLRLARQRLLAGAPPGCINGAAAQQGLLQLVHDFCDQSDALCSNCKLPQLVSGLAARHVGT